jgi:threonine/homoserine/homoserine lactone efflux protein
LSVPVTLSTLAVPGEEGVKRVPSVATFGLVALASLALLVIPGPAVLFIVTRSVENGRRLGLASVAGVHLGTLVHVSAAAAGLSALLVASATAFSVVKYAGAAYLVGLGLHRLLAPPTRSEPRGDDPLASARTIRSAVTQGAVVNILNPKVALFFLAFLPPFVDPRRGSVASQVLLLGLTYLLLGLLSDGAYALAASAIARRVRSRGGLIRRGRRASGVVYLALGALAALAPRHPPPVRS